MECIKEKIYSLMPDNYYASQMHGRGLRSWWFKKRQKTVGYLVGKYNKGNLVLDIGCGNCLWHDKKISVLGIDICEAMLLYNKQNMLSFFPLKADIFNGLPLKPNSVDTIVIAEVLEHFYDYSSIIEEIERVLKINGIVIVSVPYSRLPGIWGILFPLWCKYKWWKDKDEYYLNKCGHKADFNINMIFGAFSKFSILEHTTVGLLTIFLVAKKIK